MNVYKWPFSHLKLFNYLKFTQASSTDTKLHINRCIQYHQSCCFCVDRSGVKLIDFRLAINSVIVPRPFIREIRPELSEDHSSHPGHLTLGKCRANTKNPR